MNEKELERVYTPANTDWPEAKTTEGFSPCPLCGKTDRLDITTEESYGTLYLRHGTACIAIECKRCHLTLYNHDDTKVKYEAKRQALMQEWNRLRAVSKDGAEESTDSEKGKEPCKE